MVKKIILCVVAAIIFFGAYVFVLVNKAGMISVGKPIDAYPDAKSALVIIDMQRDLTEKTGKMPINPAMSDAIINNLNMIMEKNRKLTVVYVSHEFEGVLGLLAGGALRHGKPGTEIDPRIKIVSENRFTKHISDSFSNPAFGEFLVKNHINHLYIAGLDARYCVNKTVRAALNRKYKVTVLYDAIGSATPQYVDQALTEFNKIDVELVKSEKAIAAK